MFFPSCFQNFSTYQNAFFQFIMHELHLIVLEQSLIFHNPEGTQLTARREYNNTHKKNTHKISLSWAKLTESQSKKSVFRRSIQIMPTSNSGTLNTSQLTQGWQTCIILLYYALITLFVNISNFTQFKLFPTNFWVQNNHSLPVQLHNSSVTLIAACTIYCQLQFRSLCHVKNLRQYSTR